MKRIIIVINLVVFLLLVSNSSFGQQTEQQIIVASNFSHNGESMLGFYSDIVPFSGLDLGKNLIGEIKFFKQDKKKLILAKSTGKDNGIFVVDIDKKEIVGKILDGIEILRIEINSEYIYALTNTNELLFIDLNTLMVKNMIDLKKLKNNGSFNIGISKNFVYVVEKSKSEGIGEIFRFDRNGNEQFIGKILSKDFPIENTLIVTSSDENRIYITLKNQIVEFNLNTGKLRSILTSSTLPKSVCFDETTQTVNILSSSFIENVNVKTGGRREFFLIDYIENIELSGTTIANNGVIFANIAGVVPGDTREVLTVLVKVNLETGEVDGFPVVLANLGFNIAGVVIVE
ncbi:MAG: hypothetical protein HYR87_07765 [Thaumarchaeota archaeon]|nr:hypothetical protein [Nitrososphaerota archaeon]